MLNNNLTQHGAPLPTIYLFRTVLSRPIRYCLRLTFWDNTKNVFRSRKLTDLGTDPGQHLHYPNDTCFHLNPDLVHKIAQFCGRDLETELEHLLWPFVDPGVQRKMEHFFPRCTHASFLPPGTKLISLTGLKAHSFDKRRIHFLRFGSTDQGRVFKIPPRLEAKLLNRSRDELEQYFLGEESRLKEHELKSYLYASLNLQKHFTESFARSVPQALPPEKIDEFFLKEICLLNDNRNFWQDRSDYDRLPEYLIRYIILFFDSRFPRRNSRFQQAQDFINKHRHFTWSKGNSHVSKDEFATIFEESVETLGKADKQEITRLYRQKAKSIHPDTGGDQEAFIRLTEAYEALLRQKGDV